jgi:two-component system, cell cycle sensor histidine kinase and response regulator CckA
VKSVRTWLTASPSAENPSLQQVAQQLRFLAGFFLLLTIVSWGVASIIAPTILPAVGMSVLMALVYLAVLILAHRQQIWWAGRLLIIGMWLGLILVALVHTGITSPAYQGLIVVTLCAGLLLGMRAALICAFASMLAGFGLITVHALQLVPMIPIADNRVIWLMHAFTMFTCVVILHSATGSIRASLLDAQHQLRERHDAEQALRNNEEQLASLLAAIPDLVVTFSGDGVYLQLQMRDDRLSLRPVEQLIGQSVFQILPEPTARQVYDKIQAAIATQTPQELEYEIISVDGVARWFLARASAYVYRDEQRVVWLARDITERKHLEQQLLEQDRLYRRAITIANAVPYYRDYRTEQYTFVGDEIEPILGYPKEMITPQFVASLVVQNIVHGVSPDTPMPEAIALARRGVLKEWLCDSLIRTKSGELRWLTDASIQINDANGQAIGSLGILQDITDRKRIEEQLRQAQKLEAVGQLAGGLAHDFNNLLTIILNYTALLRDQAQEADLPSWVASDVRQIEHAAERASILTRQLLAFSRRQVLNPQLLSLNSIIEQIRPMLERVVGVPIELQLELAPDLQRVRIDAGQFEQVLINLVVNARDAMPAGGMLTLRSNNLQLDTNSAFGKTIIPAGRYVLLQIIDSGTGMDTETKSHIFEPFFTTKKQGNGTGLGLATVYGIIEQSGGLIGVESEVGQGSTFAIYLSVAAEAELTSNFAEQFALNTTGTETILVIDDDEAVSQVTTTILERAGYRVIQLENTDAEIYCRSVPHQIDLVLSDIMMPGINGIELGRRLIAIRPTLCIMLMSGFTDEIMPDLARNGQYSFIQKPFTAQQLLSQIRQFLDAQI